MRGDHKTLFDGALPHHLRIQFDDWLQSGAGERRVDKNTATEDPGMPREQLVEFLFTYHAPSQDQINRMQRVRNAAKALALELDACLQPCADRTAAMRSLQECVNTANRGITLDGVSYR